MRLYWSSRSPFARKVMVAAHELGLASRIETERVVVSAWTANPAVMQANPLGRIPTLVLADGNALYDSRVICDYLDAMAGGGHLRQPDDWEALRLQALGDALAEIGVLRLGERNRGDAARSAAHLAAYATKTAAGLDRLEQEAPSLDQAGRIGQITVACALAHLDFRFPDDMWAATRPALAAWHRQFCQRQSMQLTHYRDEY